MKEESVNDSSNHPVRAPKDKIKTLSELGVLANDAREKGLRVVLCHGVFDLVHMGHVRHLAAARKEGDILVVTTTADHLVNKGPGRPIFTASLRAEMLAALEYVDWVGISQEPTSERVLEIIKPNFYVKGADYENAEDDVTGNIVRERQITEKHGGNLVFTRDISFSSSELINKYLNIYDRPLRDFLDIHKERNTVQEIYNSIEKARDFRVLMVGDAIIDEYQYVVAMAKAPKENMIATRSTNYEIFAGGVFAAANHAASFCKEVEIVTVLGKQDPYEDLIRKNLHPNVKLRPIYCPGKPTTRKCRFIDENYMGKLFEVYHFDDRPPTHDIEEEINDALRNHIPQFDVVIANDFGHGMLTKSSIDILTNESKFLAINTQTNSANLGYNLVTKYPKADLVCVDAPEAQLATMDRFSDIESVVEDKLSKMIDCDKFVVTHGNQGCVTFEGSSGASRIPAFTKSVVDTVGAGDAFLAVSAPIAATGTPMELVGFIGNAAGAMKVSIMGHRKSIEKIPLQRFITTLLK